MINKRCGTCRWFTDPQPANGSPTTPDRVTRDKTEVGRVSIGTCGYPLPYNVANDPPRPIVISGSGRDCRSYKVDAIWG